MAESGIGMGNEKALVRDSGTACSGRCVSIPRAASPLRLKETQNLFELLLRDISMENTVFVPV